MAGAKRARAPAFHVEFVSDLSAMATLAERWEALNRGADHDAPFFQSYAWSAHVVRTRSDDTAFRPLIALARRDGELVGLWPLSLQQRTGAWVACSLDDPFGQFAGVAFADRADIAPGVAAIVAALRGRADALQIEAVPADSALHAALREAGATVTAKQDAVFADLDALGSFDAMLQAMNAKTRRNLRNMRHRFERAHRMDHVAVEHPAATVPLVRETFDSRLHWLERNGRTSPAFRHPAFRMLMERLPEVEGIRLTGFELRADEAAAARFWGIEYAGKFYAYMSAIEPEFDAFSPGRLHLGMVFEQCFARGLHGVELMPPPAQYKLEWTSSVKSVETMAMPLSTRGRVALGVATWLMPRVRRLSRILPEPLRKTLVHSLNRR